MAVDDDISDRFSFPIVFIKFIEYSKFYRCLKDIIVDLWAQTNQVVI